MVDLPRRDPLPRSGRGVGVRVVVASAMIVLGACAGQVPHPSPAQVNKASLRWPGTNAQQLEEGRSLYVNRCSGCHTLRLPQAYPADRWPVILDKMKKLAKLSDEDQDKILHYILTMKESGEAVQ